MQFVEEVDHGGSENQFPSHIDQLTQAPNRCVSSQFLVSNVQEKYVERQVQLVLGRHIWLSAYARTGKRGQLESGNFDLENILARRAVTIHDLECYYHFTYLHRNFI